MNRRTARAVLVLLAVVSSFLAPTALLADDWISYEVCKANFEPPEDRATVYFYRPKQKVATGVSFAIYNESGETLALIINNYFVPVFLPPGVNDLKTQKSMLIKPVEFSLDLEAGKTYYVKTLVKSGGMKNKPIIEEVSEAEALPEISTCRLYVNKDVRKDISKLPDFIGLE